MDDLVVLVDVVGDRARLGEPVALLDAAADALSAARWSSASSGAAPLVMKRRLERSCSLHERMLREGEHDGRRDIARGDAVPLDRGEELGEVEARHRHDRRPAPQARR